MFSLSAFISSCKISISDHFGLNRHSLTWPCRKDHFTLTSNKIYCKYCTHFIMFQLVTPWTAFDSIATVDLLAQEFLLACFIQKPFHNPASHREGCVWGACASGSWMMECPLRNQFWPHYCIIYIDIRCACRCQAKTF